MPFANPGLRWLLRLALVALASPAAAASSGARARFVIPAGPANEALIQLALQANITILNTDLCRGQSPRLVGTLKLDQAFNAIIRTSDCAFESIGPQAFNMVPRRRPALRAPPLTPPPATQPAISELTVTASKRETSIDALAGSVSIVTGARAKYLGASDASDISGLLSGVATTNLGPGRDKLLLRGLSDGAFTGRTASPVGILLDGVPLTYNAPDPDLRLSDLQRVEVARGPQGALYGAGSISGIYRMVTNKPDTEAFSAEAQAMLATTQGGGVSHSADAMLNMPLAPGKLAVRLVGYDEVQGGYAKGLFTKKSNLDRSLRRGGRVAVRLQLDDWRIDLSGASQRLQTADAHYVTLVGGKLLRTQTAQEAHWNAFEEVALTIDGQGSWGHLSSTTGFVRHSYTTEYDATASLAMLGQNPQDLAIYQEEADTRILVNDTILHSPDTQRLRWLAGLYLSSSNDRTPSSLRSERPKRLPIIVYSEDRRDAVKDAALYGELTYDLAWGWTVNAGGRAFQTSIQSQNVALINRRVQRRARKLTYEGLSPSFSVQHPVGRRGLVYGLYSEGYRAGGVNSLGLGRGSSAPAIFKPDRLQNYEIGAKLYFLHDKARLRAALFYEDWHNVQTDQYTTTGGSFTANVGDAHDLGLGLEFRYDFNENLSFDSHALFTEAELSRANSKYIKKPAGSLPGVPELSVGGYVEYRHPVTDSLSINFAAQVNYIGMSQLTFESNSPVMGDYFSGRISAELESKRWSAGVFIDNPTNETGDTFAYGNPFSLGQVRQATPQRPRTVGVRLSSSF